MSEIILYTAADNRTQIEVKFDNETVWLSLNQIAALFGMDKSIISRHLKNIFESEELNRISVVANFATTANDGKTYEVDYFNLNAIISVGYRVNSKQGTQFRQ
jgi:DNA ligase (NAD+)